MCLLMIVWEIVILVKGWFGVSGFLFRIVRLVIFLIFSEFF